MSPVNINWAPTVLQTGDTKNEMHNFFSSREEKNHINIMHYKNYKGGSLHEIL